MNSTIRVDWQHKRLDELGFVGRGKSKHRPRNDPSLYGGEYPFIQTGEIKAANLYISRYLQTYNEKGLAQSKLWEPGTLCITIAANVAETAILKIRACFPDSVVGFIADPEKSDTRFVKYYLDTLKLQMQSISRGTTQDNLPVEKLLSFKLFVPQVFFQRKISAILSAYDDFIENNNRRIQILEEMAQRIYREWFVNFRFLGHERGKFVSSEFGKIPEGWSIENLGDICDIVMGQSPKSEFYNVNGQGLPFHQGVTDFNKIFPKTRIYCTVQNRLAEEDDTLFSVRAPVGRINVSNAKIVIGRGLCAIRSKTNRQCFVLMQLKEKFKEEDTMGGGTIFKSVTKDDMHSIKMLVPPDGLIISFEKIIGPILKQLRNLTDKNEKLGASRDILLSKLISGEVDVSEKDVVILEQKRGV